MDDEKEGSGLSVGRILNGLLRFKWLIVGAALLGLVASVFAYRLVRPEYTVQGAIWVNIDNQGTSGPITQAGLLEETGWLDLLRSFTVLDPVVVEERLYLRTHDDYEHLFDDFELADRFVPGEYVLALSESGDVWRLTTKQGIEVETAEVGDSIGRELGFLWVPDPEGVLSDEEVEFRVVNPRDASRQLSDQLQAQMDRQGNFIRLSLRGPDPERLTRVLESVMGRHVSVAADLKRAKLDELTVILREQLASIQQELQQAESDLESFRIATITLPTDQSAPIAPGLEQTRAPVFQDYFDRRLELETARRDLERLRAILDSLPEADVRVESFELIPAASSSSQLQQALQELTTKRAELRALRQQYTDDYQPVREVRAEIRTLEQTTLPSLTRSLVAELEDRAMELEMILTERSGELEEIPPRSIEEARLERRVQIADRLYVDLRQRYETARLAAASSIPDIQILDEPRVPSVPSTDDRLRFAAMAFFGLLGLGMGAAVLIDWFDPRLRYLTEVSEDIGVEILGTVPRLRSGRNDNSHIVFEAFRDIRMRTEFAHGPTKPLVLAITSPDTGEGKTFMAANLAIAFAQLGTKTLLVDADTRRGDLHELFDRERKPGLTDLLQDSAEDAVMCRTGYENLTLLPSGSRTAASPEFLSSSRMQRVLAELKKRYEVIIIDSPPMAAGSDAFVLGAHAGNLLLVLRSGSTHKEMAKDKLETFLRLPVRILGAVFNDVDPNVTFGSYQYYSSYHSDYAIEYDRDDAEAPVPSSLPSG